jgi:hypothetical protein
MTKKPLFSFEAGGRKINIYSPREAVYLRLLGGWGILQYDNLLTYTSLKTQEVFVFHYPHFSSPAQEYLYTREVSNFLCDEYIVDKYSLAFWAEKFMVHAWIDRTPHCLTYPEMYIKLRNRENGILTPWEELLQCLEV